MNKNSKNEKLQITKIPYDELLTRTVSERLKFEKRRYTQELKKSGMSDSVKSRIKFAFHPENLEIKDLDPHTLNRWTLNYLRHGLTNYDFLCTQLDRTNQKDYTSYLQLRRRTFQLIAEAYPQFAEECKRQCCAER